jgi:hypothetical protein
MRKADNFDAKKWLVENKITTQSKLNEDEELGTPSEGMHNTLLSYIRQDARATYPKDYNKYFIFLRAQAKPMSGPNKPQIWMKFLKDLVKNKAISMNDLIDFSEEGYNSGGPGLEGLATYLFKQGNPEILRKIDNLSKSKLNENEDLTSKIAALPDFETSPDTEEATLIVGNYAVVHYDQSNEGGEDMYVVWDNTRDQEEIGSYDDEPEFESADPAEVAAFLKSNS